MGSRENPSVKVTVRVYPASKRSSVGGRYGASEPPVLVVRVTAPAVDGKANEAVLESVAAAFGIPRRDARVASGAHSRTKVVELAGADPGILTVLLGASTD